MFINVYISNTTIIIIHIEGLLAILYGVETGDPREKPRKRGGKKIGESNASVRTEVVKCFIFIIVNSNNLQISISYTDKFFYHFNFPFIFTLDRVVLQLKNITRSQLVYVDFSCLKEKFSVVDRASVLISFNICLGSCFDNILI